jgi:hypothetical protein
MSFGYNLKLTLSKTKRKGPVAQSVEQRIENPCVGGSIPPQATRIFNENNGLSEMVARFSFVLLTKLF